MAAGAEPVLGGCCAIVLCHEREAVNVSIFLKFVACLYPAECAGAGGRCRRRGTCVGDGTKMIRKSVPSPCVTVAIDSLFLMLSYRLSLIY